MAAGDVAEMLGVSSAAVVYNWARAAESPCPASADRRPIAPMRDSEERACDGFEGSLEGRVRRLGLENDILRAVAKALKAESPSPMTNREKALAINVFGQVPLSEVITESFRVWARNFFGFGHGRAASFPTCPA